MAKGQIALGKFRGKVGGQVLRVDAGIGQIISEYNPNPRNPRTTAQTEQRSKMNLAGKISKLTPYIAIAGMDANKRTARSKFVGKMLKNISNMESGTSSVRSDLQQSQLVLSTGRSANLAITPSYAAETGVLSVSVANGLAGQPIEGVRIVCYIIDADGFYRYCMVKDTEHLVGTTAQTITFQMPSSVQANGGVAAVYAIPVFSDVAGASVAYAQGVTSNDEFNDFRTTASRTLATIGAFGESQFINKVVLGE
mgnify:CR=1 FL=1